MSNLSNIDFKIRSVQIHAFEVNKIVTFHKYVRCVQWRFYKGVLNKHFLFYSSYKIKTFLWNFIAKMLVSHYYDHQNTRMHTHSGQRHIDYLLCVDEKKQKVLKSSSGVHVKVHDLLGFIEVIIVMCKDN